MCNPIFVIGVYMLHGGNLRIIDSNVTIIYVACFLTGTIDLTESVLVPICSMLSHIGPLEGLGFLNSMKEKQEKVIFFY